MPDANQPTNYIDSTTELRGELKSELDIEIHGILEGSIESKSSVIVSRDGSIHGEIKTRDARIEGKVEGYIEARGKLVASSSSTLSCNITAERLVAEPGAVLQGEMIITPNWREELAQRGGFSDRRKDVHTASTEQPNASPEPPNLPARTVAISADFPTARKVKLYGSFNQWDKSKAYKLRRTQSGRWTTQIRLTPGTYEYLFLVNGKEEIDPNNPRKSQNAYGGVNSVLIVEPEEKPEAQPAGQETGE